MSRPENRRQELTDCACTLRLELSRMRLKEVGNSAWQHKARKLLALLRRLQKLKQNPEAAVCARAQNPPPGAR